MVITVTASKGGVGKSTTAVHLAAYLNALGPTLLVDGDPNRSVVAYAKRGQLPYRVVDERQAARHIREAEHVVIDTAARPAQEDLVTLADGCDLMIVPTTPDAMALDALFVTTDTLRSIGVERFRILLTIVPPRPNRDGDDARKMIEGSGLPMFVGSIRRLIAFQRAALAGCVVTAVKDPRAADAWSDYETIGREILR